MTKKIEPKPPRHLRAPTRRWWSNVADEYELEPHHLRLLTLAGETWDRITMAREALLKLGMTYQDRFGAPHSRPEINVERDNKIIFARLVRELALDIDPPAEARLPRIAGTGD